MHNYIHDFVKLAKKTLFKTEAAPSFQLFTLNDLVGWTRTLNQIINEPYDIVVGIPRSGLLAASMLSTINGKLLSTPQMIVQNEVWQSGNRTSIRREYKQTLLLVDDTFYSGNSIKQVMDLFERTPGFYDKFNVLTAVCAVIENYSKKLYPPDSVMYCAQKIREPFIFEWNIVDNRALAYYRVATDMDGVICDDCTPRIDADEHLYCQWLNTVKPKLIPKYPLEAIVSNRLEKYRHHTEQWLKQHGVKYKNLYLWNLAEKSDRTDFGTWKVEMVRKISPQLFFESDTGIAQQIWNDARIPVLAVNDMKMYS